MKTTLFHKVLFLLLFVLLGGGAVKGQTDLVRWNLTANGNVSYSDPSVSGDSFSSEENAISYNSSGALVVHWNNTGFVHYRYMSISLSSSDGNPVDIASLMFEQETTNPPTNYTIRYYVSPDGSVPGSSQFFTNLSSVLVDNESISANPVKNIPLNMTISGTQKLIIRFYTYGTHWTNDIWTIKANTLKITAPALLPPTATNDNATTAQNIPVDINILANDTYGALSNINITQQPAHGQNITVNGLTNVTYTPNNDYQGSDTFKYTITDANGTSNEATVNINVIPVTAPTAVPDMVAAFQNQPVDINVLANDTQGSGAFDEVTIVTNAAHGTAVINPDKTVKYTPNTNYTGADSFQYNVTNIHNATSNTVTVSVNVQPSADLVRWGNTNQTPTTVVNNLSASNLTNSSGSSGISGHTADCGFEFRINEINAGTYNAGRYVQFSVTPDAGYNIDLSQYVFRYNRSAANANNVRIRYSKQANFSSGVQELNATNLALGEHTVTLNFPPNTVVNSGETMYFRFHIYGIQDNEWWTALCIRNTGSTSPDQGPTLRGKIRSNSTSDLSITKTVDEDEPEVDDEIKFTISVTNNGPDDATDVTVTDVLPTGYDFVSSTQGTYNVGTRAITWNIGNLATSDNTSFDVFAKVLASGTYNNTASVTANENDTNLADNSCAVAVIPFIPAADLVITGMSISNLTPTVGDNVTFTINILNNGPDAATGVAVAALLPSGFSYVSHNAGVYNNSTGIWTIGNLANGIPANIQIEAKVLPTGNYTLNAEISGGVADPISGNNSASAGLTNMLDLSIAKTVDVNNPLLGTNVVFTVTATNHGAGTATGVVINDVIPSGYEYVSSTQGTYDPINRTVTWNAGNLAASVNVSFTITAKVKGSGNYNNTVTVAANEPDNVSGNNSATRSVSPDMTNALDMKVVQTVSTETPNIGNNVTFTITATNQSTSGTTGVKVSNLLGNGLLRGVVTPSTGTFDPITGVWTIGTMAASATATLTVVAEVLGDVGAAYLSIAEITANEIDRDNNIINNKAYSILSPVGQTFHPCDVNAEEPAFQDDFGSDVSPYAPELEVGRTNMEYVTGVNIEDGQYTVAKNAQLGYTNWADIADPSGDPNGYFMIVNAGLEPHEFFRTRITLSEEFCTNTRYNINLKVINVNSAENFNYCSGDGGGYILPEIGYFVINNKGEILGAGTSGEIPYNAIPEWLSRQFVFVSGIDDEWVELVLFNKAPGGCGNDLAIDDITIYACMTPPIRLDMTIEGNKQEVCGGETVIMEVNYVEDVGLGYQWPPLAWGGGDSTSTNVEYQWQRSDDGIHYTNIAGQTTHRLTIEEFGPEDQAYYRLMYAQAGNISKQFCRFPSNDFYPVFNATPTPGPIESDTDEEEFCISKGPFQLTSAYDFSDYGPYDPDDPYYKWSSSSSSIAIIDPQTGVLTPVAPGNVTITYFVRSPKGECEGYVTRTITIRDADCTPPVITRKVISNPMLPSKAKRP